MTATNKGNVNIHIEKLSMHKAMTGKCMEIVDRFFPSVNNC